MNRIWAMDMKNLVLHESDQVILINKWMTLEQTWSFVCNKFTETGTEHYTYRYTKMRYNKQRLYNENPDIFLLFENGPKTFKTHAMIFWTLKILIDVSF